MHISDFFFSWCMGSVAPWYVRSSQTRDQTHVPCSGRQIPNHWTTREDHQKHISKPKPSNYFSMRFGAESQIVSRPVFWLLWESFLSVSFYLFIFYHPGTYTKHNSLAWAVFFKRASQVARVVKNPPANAGDLRDLGSVHGSERSPGEGHGNPLQYSCLENFMDRGAWQATVHGVIRSQTQLKWLGMHSFLKLLHR